MSMRRAAQQKRGEEGTLCLLFTPWGRALEVLVTDRTAYTLAAGPCVLGGSSGAASAGH